MNPSGTPKEQPPASPAQRGAEDVERELLRLREQIATLQADAEKAEAVPTSYDRPGAGTGHLEERLARVTGYVSRIPKRGFNKEQSYPFVAHPDVLDAIRPALAAEGVQFRSKITKTEAEAETVANGAERRTGGGMVWRMWRIEVEFRFCCWNGDVRCEQVTEAWPGYAQDYSDKGASKALTSAIKTFLIQQFLLSTGDDPDAHETRPDAQGEPQQQAARPQGGSRSATPVSGDLRQARNAALDWNKELPQGVVGKIAKKLCGNGVIIKIEDVAILQRVARYAEAYKANPEAGEAWLAGDNQALSGGPDPADVERQAAAEDPQAPPTMSADADDAAPVDVPVEPWGMPVESYDPPLTEDELRQHALGLNPRVVTDDDDTPF